MDCDKVFWCSDVIAIILFSTIILEIVGNSWITLVPIYIVDTLVFVFFVRRLSLLKESYQVNILDIVFGILSIRAMMYIFSVLLSGSGISVLWQSKIYFICIFTCGYNYWTNL